MISKSSLSFEPLFPSKLIISMLVFISLLASSSALWVIPESDPESRIFYLSPLHDQFPPIEFPTGGYNIHPVEGYVSYWNQPGVPNNVNGTVLIWDRSLSNRLDLTITEFHETGILALLILTHIETDSPGFVSWGGIHRKPKFQNPWPVFQISNASNRSLLAWMHNHTNGVYVSIGHDANPWENTFKVSLPILGFFVLLISGATMIWAAYKLTLLILRDGFQFNVAQMILWMCFAGSAVRVGFATADPFGVYNTTSHVAIEVGLSISFPFQIGSCLLIALYWHELIQKSGTKTVNPTLARMKWPFFIFFTIVLCYELTLGFLRAYAIGFIVVQTLDGVLYAVVVIGLLIFFTITRIRLQKEFNKINEGLAQSNHGKKLKLAVYQVYGISGIMVFWIIMELWVAAFAGSAYWVPIGFSVTMWGMFGTMMAISLMQVYMIRAPSRPVSWFFCGLIHPERYSEHDVS